MSEKQDLMFQYYLLAFIDILGQKQAFQSVDRIPRNEDEKKKLVEALKQTVAFIERYRTGFKDFFKGFSRPTEIVRQIPEEQRAAFNEIRACDVGYLGLSDFFIAYVSLRTESHACAALNGIFQVLGAAGSMFLICLASRHAIRGGIEVGTGIVFGNKEVYGPALNRAYYLESQMAQYPRLLIGPELIQYLKLHREQETKTIYDQYCKTISGMCLDMLAKDTDGLPILDYLGSGFRRAFTTSDKGIEAATLDDLIPKAFAFVMSEHDRCAVSGNTKLAFRYQLLGDYFARNGIE